MDLGRAVVDAEGADLADDGCAFPANAGQEGPRTVRLPAARCDNLSEGRMRLAVTHAFKIDSFMRSSGLWKNATTKMRIATR